MDITNIRLKQQGYQRLQTSLMYKDEPVNTFHVMTSKCFDDEDCMKMMARESLGLWRAW
jgi:hypothetical protein